MVKVTSRKSDPELAGEYCRYASRDGIPCPQYARYAVTFDMGDGNTGKADPVCGQHVGEAARQVWNTRNKPAILQEIPGAWRLRPGERPQRQNGRRSQ